MHVSYMSELALPEARGKNVRDRDTDAMVSIHQCHERPDHVNRPIPVGLG